jgi:hypothetical protein
MQSPALSSQGFLSPLTVARAGLSFPASRLGVPDDSSIGLPSVQEYSHVFSSRTIQLEHAELTPFSEPRQAVSATKCAPMALAVASGRPQTRGRNWMGAPETWEAEILATCNLPVRQLL